MINNAYLLQPLYTYIFQFKTPVYSFVNVGEKINITINNNNNFFLTIKNC